MSGVTVCDAQRRYYRVKTHIPCGGSGGGVLLHGSSVTLSGSGTINVAGGNGGSGAAGGGGGGASGRIHVLTPMGTATIETGFIASTAGGNGGAPNGLSGGSSGMVVGVLTPPASPPAVSGCIEMSGAAAVGATVKIRQKNTHQQAATDADGCFAFGSPVSPGDGTITIELPALP